MKTRSKKRALTLLEIMIVICLITLITGVIGYNMKGSLDKGKAFRTEQAKEQLRDMLLLALSDGEKMEDILANPKKSLTNLGLAKDPESLLKDGWNQPFSIRANRAKTDFLIDSPRFTEYKASLDKKTPSLAPTDEEEQ